jgi:ABC-type bacteriocin/lantibiotic exporter with double-glycine peptidase domain
MLTNDHIIKILREIGLHLKHTVDATALYFVEVNKRTYALDEFGEFKRDMVEAANKVSLLFMEHAIPQHQFESFLKDDNLILAFRRRQAELIPVLFHTRKRKTQQIDIDYAYPAEELDQHPWLTNPTGEVVTFIIFPYNNLVSLDASDEVEELKPVKRFMRLLGTERREIFYILFYAVLVGMIGLVLPLGIQTTVELISGGVFFSSVYLLIALVILGVMIAGALQIVQISLVEHMQRKIFAKAAFEFAFRIPRIKIESILNNHAPELVNRFFDIMTLQKGLPKLLIDLSAGAVQIFFGLLLLSLYHPFFVFFSLVLVTFLVIIFWVTGPRGLETSLKESKYKYKVVHWLEELARAINSFKLAGNTDLPIRKTDYNVNNYLKYRKSHFNILITQFTFILIFKGLVTGGLLIMGTILVVNREITLGQFVAAEIIIILILNSVEKVILYMDVVYDLLTAVDKIGHVTDLPLEKAGGIDITSGDKTEGFALQVNNLYYKYPGNTHYTLQGVSLEIKPGERICITGPEASGKTTLTNVMAGLHTGFEGGVSINGYSIRDLDLVHLRNKIAKNISAEDIFDGTFLENIHIGKPDETIDDAMWAIKRAGLQEALSKLPEGLNTHIISGGKGLSGMMIHRLILARCMAKKPRLIILNDFFSGLKKSEKLDLMQRLIDKENRWTLVAVSNDPLVMAACDRIIVMNEGRVELEGKFEELINKDIVSKYIE